MPTAGRSLKSILRSRAASLILLASLSSKSEVDLLLGFSAPLPFSSTKGPVGGPASVAMLHKLRCSTVPAIHTVENLITGWAGLRLG